MIYNVASLLTAREGTERLAAIEDGEVYTDRHRFVRVTGPVRMLRTDRTVMVSASVSATVYDTCSRCLAPAELNIDSEFEEEFEPVNRDLMSDRPAPGQSEFDPALIIDARNTLDMTDALAQALSLTVPLAPLCKPDCSGICSTCFANRNQFACKCDQNPIDPRWRSLAELSARTSNSNS